MADIDRNSPVPLYYQLKQVLLDEIRSWQPGKMIPSEQELQDKYGLSRTTVRQTLSELVVEGYLKRERGRGTFIAEPKVAYNPSVSVVDQQGVALGWQMLDQTWVEAPANVTAFLQMDENAKVMRIRRLRMAGEKSIGYHVAYVRPEIASHIDVLKLLAGESLDYIAREERLKTARIHRTLEAVEVDKTDIELLQVPRTMPILQLERLVVGEDGYPIEYLLARFRGDRFKYQITL
jgi:GntR family transcriptional regulator